MVLMRVWLPQSNELRVDLLEILPKVRKQMKETPIFLPSRAL
jgi:hypothetical protein